MLPTTSTLMRVGLARGSFVLRSDHVILKRRDDEEHYEFRRAESFAGVEWEGLSAVRPYLIARIPGRVKLKVSEVDAASLSEWFGPPPGGHLRVALRRRSAWALTIGVVWLLSSLPVAGDPVSTRPAIPFDWVAALLGAVLVLESILVRTVIRRELFLLDAAWFVGAALYTGYRLLLANSVLWGAMLAICAFCILDDLKSYGDFAPDMPPEKI